MRVLSRPPLWFCTRLCCIVRCIWPKRFHFFPLPSLAVIVWSVALHSKTPRRRKVLGKVGPSDVLAPKNAFYSLTHTSRAVNGREGFCQSKLYLHPYTLCILYFLDFRLLWLHTYTKKRKDEHEIPQFVSLKDERPGYFSGEQSFHFVGVLHMKHLPLITQIR